MEENNKRMGRQKLTSKINASINAGLTYFVGIGINDYQNWPPLQNAMRDVQALAELLVAEYGFNKSQLRLLLNEEATEANIIQLFEELANQIEPTDSLLIYYAGHGHLNQRDRGFWVPVDAPEGSVFRYIRNSTIKDYIGDINSLHTLLISDSCFSGSLFSSGTERSSELVADELSRLPSRWAICSGRHDEAVADGPSDGHSPFAESILDVLRNNTRSAITTGFLVNQVIDQTRSNYEQLPDGGPLQNVGHKRGQFVFRRQRGIGANKLWQQIYDTADHSLAQIAAKKALIRQYAADYPSGKHFTDAINLGRQLEQKHQMLEVWDSEFGLMAFVQKNTPYKQEAQQRLKTLQTSTKSFVREEIPPEKKENKQARFNATAKTAEKLADDPKSFEGDSSSYEEREIKTDKGILAQSWVLMLVAACFGATFNPVFFANVLYLMIFIALFIAMISLSYRLGLKVPLTNSILKATLLVSLATIVGIYLSGFFGISYYGLSLLTLIIALGNSLIVFIVASIARRRQQ